MREENEGGEKGREVGWEVSRRGWRDGGSNGWGGIEGGWEVSREG